MALGFTQPLTDEYQKIFLGLKRGRRVRPTTQPPPLSRMSRKGRILYLSEPCRPPRPVTGIALLSAFILLTS
jgi:hypothetical protein